MPLQPGQVEEPRNLHCKIAGALACCGPRPCTPLRQQQQQHGGSRAVPMPAPVLAELAWAWDACATWCCAVPPLPLQTLGCARTCRPPSPGWARCTTWHQVGLQGGRPDWASRVGTAPGAPRTGHPRQQRGGGVDASQSQQQQQDTRLHRPLGAIAVLSPRLPMHLCSAARACGLQRACPRQQPAASWRQAPPRVACMAGQAY